MTTKKTFKFCALLLTISLLATAAIYGALSSSKDENSSSSEEKKEIDIAKISEAFGHLIGKNIEHLDIHFDVDHVVKGLKDAAAGKESPMTETECVEAISTIQEKHFKDQSIENLKKAEEFLAQSAKQKDMVILENGKLQYKIEKSGDGDVVEEHFSPLIRYVGKYLDGTVFSSSKEDEIISLDETIPGISKGLIGMKEGEKRTLFIHPELGYGTQGYLAPNSLLSFEIEVIKAQAPENSENSLSNVSAKNAETREIAQQTEAIR